LYPGSNSRASCWAVSARSADVFLRLSPVEQARELTLRLNKAQEREERHRVAASAIREYLDTLDGKRVDLMELGSVIRAALSSSTPG
jgi:hypothetical protein